MLTDQCISVTDLKKQANKHIKDLKSTGSKVVFVNNKPVAVLVDIDHFNLQIEEPFEFHFGTKGIDPKDILDHFGKH